MASNSEVFVTSRSRTPSIIDVACQNEHVFSQFPDYIQEAAVSMEFSSPSLRITRVHNDEEIGNGFMTQPMFYISPANDSGISMIDISVTDSKVLSKFGADLTANFADIRAYGSDAFFQKPNLSDGSKISICACVTGYIWVYIPPKAVIINDHFSDVQIQIGTFALNTRAIKLVEIPCQFKYIRNHDLLESQLALFCTTVLAKYLQQRIIGQQYEYAVETAISQTRKQLAYMRIVDPGIFGNMNATLREVCSNAPMPPTSDVSLISRSMINRRWQCWRQKEDRRRGFSFSRRALEVSAKIDRFVRQLFSGS